MYYIVVSTYPSLLALGLYSSQPLQPLEPQNAPAKEMRLPPPLRPAEPGQCLTPLSMRLCRTYSKYLGEMLTFISLREMLTFISLRSIKLATHQIPPRQKNRAPILGPPSDSIKEKLGPRHRSHPGKNSGPDAWASFRPGGLSGPVIRALVPPGRKLGPRCSGPNKFPGYRSLVSPPELMPLCSNLPLSLSSPWVHHVTADLFLCAAIGSVSPR